MSFLGKIFKGVGKVVGGLATSVVKNATGGLIDLTPTPKPEVIYQQAPAPPPVVNNGVFAGVPATVQGNTVAITKPLDEVNISVPRAKSASSSSLLDKIGDVVSNLGRRATEQATVGIDPKTLLIVGAIGLGLVLVVVSNKK